MVTLNESLVSISRSNGYSAREVSDVLRACLRPLGGIERFVKRGNTVLIKPNLLSAKNPERAITTHPSIIRSLCEVIREEGGTPVVGDSPAGIEGGVERLWRETGMLDVSREKKIELLNFESGGAVEYSVNGRKYHIARAVREADVVINVPKLKTHSLVLYTGALKNTFGTLPGFQKSEFHKSNPSHGDFSRVLVEVFSLVKPALTVMDAIVAMEGEGPASGKPREVGMVIASEDGVALDTVVTRMIGLSRNEVNVLDLGAEMGLGNADFERIQVAGAPDRDWRIQEFSLPSNRAYRKLAPIAIRALGEFVWIRPVEDREKCTLCAICVKNCPVSAIEVKKKSLQFDYEKCIDCMCCHEICPENAIRLKKSFLAKLVT